jgi:hypothetical protein
MKLILDIADYLSLGTRLIMQQICSKFRNGLAPRGISPEMQKIPLTMKEIFQFASFIQRDIQLRLQDDYDQDCDLASLNSTFHRVGCSGYRKTHEIRNFSAEQLSLSPKLGYVKALRYHFDSVNIFHSRANASYKAFAK